jgi:hypothetical protein
MTISPVQGTPAPVLATAGVDGTLVTAALPVEPFLGAADQVIFVSPGHGMWHAISDSTTHFTFVGLAASPAGTWIATATIRGSLDLAPDGATLVGSYHAVVSDPAGNELATELGQITAIRITASAQPERRDA